MKLKPVKVNAHHCDGYTLIEILIVLFIISIVTSLALLNISHNENKHLESFTGELTQMLTLAQEQAMLQPEVLGFLLKDRDFQFASLQSKGSEQQTSWMPLEGSQLGLHHLPNDIQLRIEMGDGVSATSQQNPKIIISTNGEVTPFAIYVSKIGEKPRYVITGTADGNITNKMLS